MEKRVPWERTFCLQRTPLEIAVTALPCVAEYKHIVRKAKLPTKMQTLDGKCGSVESHNCMFDPSDEIQLEGRSTSVSRPGRSCSRKGMAFCFRVSNEGKNEVRLDKDRKIQVSVGSA